MARAAYRCPVCSFAASSENELNQHIVEQVEGSQSRWYENNLPEIVA